jgi:hypothetical protein
MMPDLAPPPGPELPPPPTERRRRWFTRRGRDSRRTPDRPCMNCGDPTVGFFCPTCGQRKVEVRVSLRRMIAETLEDELFLNHTLPRTIGALLLRPGHLTREYVEGRIVRYIQPIRLYLISSIVLFVLLPWLTNMSAFEEQMRIDEARADSIAAATGDTAAATLSPTVVRPGSEPLPIRMAVRDTLEVPRLLRPVNRRLLETEDRLRAMPAREAVRTIRIAFTENAPTGIFLMMPVFALILKVLYVRRKRYYVEHVVFALHVHAFTFLMILVMLIAPGSGALNALLGLWLTLYVFFALRTVYDQGWVKTFVKYLMLGAAYAFVLTFGVLFTVLLTALTV